jgi:uncharacterized protein (DUF488 family)
VTKTPTEFVNILTENGIRCLVDIRWVSNRAHSGAFVKAKTPAKGIEALLQRAGIEYRWVQELGKPYMSSTTWRKHYQALLESEGATRIQAILDAPEPFCLMCGEKLPDDCHPPVEKGHGHSRPAKTY